MLLGWAILFTSQCHYVAIDSISLFIPYCKKGRAVVRPTSFVHDEVSTEVVNREVGKLLGKHWVVIKDGI